MNLSPQVQAALVAAVVTLVGYFLNRQAARRSRDEQQRDATAAAELAAENAARAYEVSLSAESRQWLQQAQADAQGARNEAAAARKEATEARADAEAAGRAMRDATDRFESVMRWVERVVRTAHDNPDDLVRIVNGGPPELTASRIPRPR